MGGEQFNFLGLYSVTHKMYFFAGSELASGEDICAHMTWTEVPFV